jgi:hypothetical protein
MIASFVGLVVIPMVIAGLARWAAARRRRGLAAGRAVHFRCRLDGHKGRLLVDARLDGPVFLDRSGNVTALPRGGEALDATVSTNGRPPFEKVNLRYRTPEGQVLRLRLATHDARTLGAWLGEQNRRPSRPPDGCFCRPHRHGRYSPSRRPCSWAWPPRTSHCSGSTPPPRSSV